MVVKGHKNDPSGTSVRYKGNLVVLVVDGDAIRLGEAAEECPPFSSGEVDLENIPRNPLCEQGTRGWPTFHFRGARLGLYRDPSTRHKEALSIS